MRFSILNSKNMLFINAVLCLFILRVQASEIHIEILKDKTHPIAKELYGVNSMLMAKPAKFNDPAIIDFITQMDGVFMRYPGGTPANYWDWKSGFTINPKKAPEATKQKVKDLDQSMRARVKLSGAEDYRHFCETAKKTATRFSFVLNIASENLENNTALMKAMKAEGAQLTHIELGNEVYFNQYNWAFESAEQYTEIAEQHSQMIRKIFPEAKIGVVIPSHIYTKENFLQIASAKPHLKRQDNWLKTLSKKHFYDAVIIHLYSDTGVSAKATELKPSLDMYYHCWSHADSKLDFTFQTIRQNFPQKDVWVTEYHIGGFSGIARKSRLRYSYLGGLFTAGFLLKMCAYPEIKLASWHSAFQLIEFPNGIHRSGLSNDFRFKKTKTNFEFLTFFKEPIRTSTKFIPVKISGTNSYPKLGDYNSDRQDLEAGFFSVDNQHGTLLLINKHNKSYELSQVLINQKLMRIQSSSSIIPSVKKELIQSLEHEWDRQIKQQKGSTIKILPYSLTKIKLSLP